MAHGLLRQKLYQIGDMLLGSLAVWRTKKKKERAASQENKQLTIDIENEIENNDGDEELHFQDDNLLDDDFDELMLNNNIKSLKKS